jgi:hypothetical protein
MQNNAVNCKCETEDKYCSIPFKVIYCSFYTLNKNEPHILINMKNNKLDINKINKIFKYLPNNIKKSKLIKRIKKRNKI